MNTDAQQPVNNAETTNTGGKNMHSDMHRASPRAYSLIPIYLFVVGAIIVGFVVAASSVISDLSKDSEEILALIAQTRASLLESQATSLKHASDSQTTAIENAKNDLITRLAADAAPAGNSAGVHSKQAAAGDRALALGKKALEDGKTEQAILLFINGINHNPGRFELVRALADAASNTSNPELAEHAIGVLEMATMRVAPDDIPETLNQIARLKEKHAPGKPVLLTPEEALKQWEEIQAEYSPDKVWENNVLINQGLSAIEFLGQHMDISMVDGNDERFDNIMRECLELSARLQAVQSSLPIYVHIAKCVEQMREALNAHTPDATLMASISASAQGVLSQAWGQMQNLPEPMRAAFNQLPAQINQAQEEFQNKTSIPILEKVRATLDEAVNNPYGSFTERINRIATALDEATAEVDLITSRELRNEFFKKAKEARNVLLGLELGRRAAYQRWALEKLNGFMREWNGSMYQSAASAKDLFQAYQIVSIDETLLTPEVARMFARVMSCMTGKLGAKGGSDIEYDLASSYKKRLEGF